MKAILLIVAILAAVAFAKRYRSLADARDVELTMGQKQAWTIIKYEARFDKNGNLEVYKLPTLYR